MVFRHEEAWRAALSGCFRVGTRVITHSKEKTLLACFFCYLQSFELTFDMDPRLYDVQAAIDASFALEQQGNEGSSAAQRGALETANSEEMAAADRPVSAVATSASNVTDDIELAIKASVTTYREEKAREAGHFWALFNSPI